MSEDTDTKPTHREPSLIEIMLGITGCAVLLLDFVYLGYTVLAKTFDPFVLIAFIVIFILSLVLFALASIISLLHKLAERK